MCVTIIRHHNCVSIKHSEHCYNAYKQANFNILTHHKIATNCGNFTQFLIFYTKFEYTHLILSKKIWNWIDLYLTSILYIHNHVFWVLSLEIYEGGEWVDTYATIICFKLNSIHVRIHDWSSSEWSWRTRLRYTCTRFVQRILTDVCATPTTQVVVVGVFGELYWCFCWYTNQFQLNILDRPSCLCQCESFHQERKNKIKHIQTDKRTDYPRRKTK